MQVIINNKDDMIELARTFAKFCKKRDVILLNGDLGAGKTFFTKHFAKFLGVTDEVMSPTFTIAKEYYAKSVTLYHVDAYRLEDADENNDYLYDFYENGITVIEWPEYVSDYLPYSYVQLYIKYDGGDKRKISISFVNKDELESRVCEYEL
ncbi:MAG: tRNA (adenosine(37)-N6)-threonylcarbamoyltransferase complex ATPase subunit type 1 TsaE [Bacilli bacterium]